MFNYTRIVFFAFIFIVFQSFLYSVYINIPLDYPTIQQGINAASNGDVVIVAEGTYSESINFNGKSITVASRYLLIPDTTYISSTIIGNVVNQPVVKFTNGENSSAILSGFTITNGHTTIVGEEAGGIYCAYSSPTLENLIITNNETYGNGGGIYCYESSPSMKNVTISENKAWQDGGGIYCDRYSNPNLKNVVISDNDTSGEGGGIFHGWGGASWTILENVTITGNSTGYTCGGVYCSNSKIKVKNSIIYGNEYNNIGSYDGTIYVTYSDIEGGAGIGNIIGNIESDPLFVSVAGYDYHLQSTSPCINTGDPASPLDPDGSRAEMGAYYHPYSGPVWNVSTTGSDVTGNGSEEFPFATIQYGIDASANADTVLVQPGTYVENISYNGKLMTLGSLFLTTGDESYITSTIIDGNATSRVVTFANGEDSNAVLKGFTITNGSTSYGAGIYCNGASPTLENLIVTGNTATTGGGGVSCYNCSPTFNNVAIVDNITNNQGGGIYSYGSSPVYENVTISGNSAATGGGIWNYTSTPNIENSILWNNSPQEIYASSSTITVTYSNIQGGYTGTGNIDSDPSFVDASSGNYYLQQNSPCIDAGDPTFPLDPDSTTADIGAYYFHKEQRPVWHISTVGSDITGNGSEELPFASIQLGINFSTNTDTVLVQPGTYTENINLSGKLITLGSLFLTTQDTSYISSTIIDGNNSGRVVLFVNGENSSTVLSGFTIKNGLASGASWEAYGGGIYCSHSSPSLNNLRILGNYANHGGGIFCNNSSPSLEGLLITENSVLYSGGGIGCVYSSYPSVQNVTISNNTAGTDGGAFSCAYDATPSLTNSILWNNSSPEIYLSMGGGVTATYSDIQGGWSGNGNINNDPLFADGSSGNYHLQPTSPCIDAGDPSSPLDPDSTRVDIGVYYYHQIISLDSPQNVMIETIDADVNISWDEVTYANSYIVYNSSSPNSNYSFLGLSAETNYTHQLVSQFSNKNFYRISAYNGDLKSLKSFIAEHPKFKKKELDAFIEEKKR